jgi:NADH-ubiquinone oxidoreductase chain 5
MYFCILILPFLSFFSTNLLGRYIGIYGCCILATSSIAFSFLLSLIAFYEVAICGSPCTLSFMNWFQSELFLVSWGFYFDTLSTVMLLVVCGVSSLVHLYSTEYMSHDPHQGRFMGYLSLFTGFMLLLVTADNFLIMFLGWEGIGLASFLLIGFWYTRIQASKSAIKAMLVNRVGDLGLALGICSVFLTFKTVDYPTVFALTPCVVNDTFSFLSFEVDRLTAIALLLFWGALGKSAQIGLHIWLPDAMEGPTPVSALIHAATLVTAGVFLIIRCSIIFENSGALIIVTCVGALTAFFASSVGLVQNDLKRVIAYSTCSQLGYMVFAAGLSHYSISLFHLANHALFKALLFLSAGCIIHGVSDEQDMRKMGGLIKLFPTSYTMILIGSLALVGFPFLTGFYSKDAILEVAVSKGTTAGNYAHFLGCCAAFCTSFYSFRLVFLTFINKTNVYKKYIDHAHDAPIRMVFPLMVLALGAIFWGFLSRDLMIGLGSPAFGNSLYNNIYNYNLIDSEFLMAILKNIPFIFTLLGACLSLFLINCYGLSKNMVYSLKMSKFYRSLYTFLTQKWHFDQINNELISVRTMNFGYRSTFQLIDKGNIEVLGPLGYTYNLVIASKTLSQKHSGLLYHHSLAMMLALLSLLALLAIILFDTLSNSSILFIGLIFSYISFSLTF